MTDKRSRPFVMAAQHVMIVQILHILPMKPLILVKDRTKWRRITDYGFVTCRLFSEMLGGNGRVQLTAELLHCNDVLPGPFPAREVIAKPGDDACSIALRKSIAFWLAFAFVESVTSLVRRQR